MQWFMAAVGLSARLAVVGLVQKLSRIPDRLRGRKTPEEYFYDEADREILYALFSQFEEEGPQQQSKVRDAYEQWKHHMNLRDKSSNR